MQNTPVCVGEDLPERSYIVMLPLNLNDLVRRANKIGDQGVPEDETA